MSVYKPGDDLSEALNELRLIVLQEEEDGKFRQVGLDNEQFKNVSAAVCVSIRKDPSLRPDYEMAEVRINPDWEMDADHFLGLASTYDFNDEV